jgi:hypothetical protein
VQKGMEIHYLIKISWGLHSGMWLGESCKILKLQNFIWKHTVNLPIMIMLKLWSPHRECDPCLIHFSFPSLVLSGRSWYSESQETVDRRGPDGCLFLIGKRNSWKGHLWKGNLGAKSHTWISPTTKPGEAQKAFGPGLIWADVH